jgi:CRP-like cAMP-binding protein
MPSFQELGDQLQRSRLFASLSADQTQRLASRASVRRLPDKVPLSLPADDSRKVHLMLSGRAKVCYLTQDGKQPILYFVDRDELVGELAIVNGTFGDEYVETIEPSLVASMSVKDLRELMLSESGFAASISELIAARRSQAERRLRQLLFLSNRERLTHLLLELAGQYGSKNSDHIDLRIKLSHQDLANFIGSTRETVTVVLGKMQLDGLISVRRRRITLLDVRNLARSVDRPLPSFMASRL